MKEYVYPTTRGRTALLLVILYCLSLFWAESAMPDLYPPLSGQPEASVEQVLKRVQHSALFATFSVIPIGLIIGWCFINSIKTQKWPSLGKYVPIKLRVRTLKNTWSVWLALAIAEGHLLLVVLLAWWHYFQVRNVLASHGGLPTG